MGDTTGAPTTKHQRNGFSKEPSCKTLKVSVSMKEWARRLGWCALYGILHAYVVVVAGEPLPLLAITVSKSLNTERNRPPYFKPQASQPRRASFASVM